MVPAVTRVLGRAFDPSRSYTMGRAWKLAVLVRFQVEVQDRFSGLDRSPQQAESLAAAGDNEQF